MVNWRSVPFHAVWRGLALLLCSMVAGMAVGQAPSPAADPGRTEEIQQLRLELARISARLDALEGHAPAAPIPATASAPVASAPAAQPPVPEAAVSPTPSGPYPPQTPAPMLTADDAPGLGFLRTTTINLNFDGYYGYNFNQPVGGVNLLRAYDVTSNSFNLNQVDLILERLPTQESRFGGRLDLMWGQATETLQGSPANEQRPQVWRNVFQAYGSYLAPLGTGLQLDFGKFASSLGSEGNYTKDQIAYSARLSFLLSALLSHGSAGELQPDAPGERGLLVSEWRTTDRRPERL